MSKTTKSNKTKLSIIALTLVMCMMVVGISAYFTDADTATNTFTVGKVELDLQEPTWDPDEVEDVVPNEEIDKDPQIENTGVNSEYVFLEVKVPYATIKTAAADGTVSATAEKTELFSFEKAASWHQLSKTDFGTEAEGYITYVFAYGTADEMTAVAADEITDALFSTVKFVNAVEDQNLEEVSKDIVINAYGIQSENIEGEQDAQSIWEVVSNAQPSTDKPAENPKTDKVG